MDNTATLNSKNLSLVLSKLEDEAFAAVNLNPAVTWAKFILTDDQPNQNNQRVPQEEFDNLIRTGMFMPVKMAFGQINEGHEDSFPLGSITHLKKVDNRLEGLAALWTKEREEDVQYLKEAFDNGQDLNLSWEIFYKEGRVDENGVENLVGTILRAVTLVGMPAYAGRTKFLAVASKWSDAYLKDLPDSHFLHVTENKRLYPYRDKEGNVDLQQVQRAISNIEKMDDSESLKEQLLSTANEILVSITNQEDTSQMDEKIEKLQEELDKSQTALGEATTRIAELEKALEEKASLVTEVEELREFKASIEAEKERIEKMQAIKDKFSDAGVEKDEEYFDANAEKLLALSEEMLDFMIQEMVAFASKEEKKEERESQSSVPNLKGERKTTVDAKELGQKLRQSLYKK